MSDEANGKDNGKTVDGKSVCRDFLNNICNRGSRCKFFHPEVEKPAMANGEDPYNFCIDFQNQGCYRENCRFIHAHQDDVERYKKTGDVTLSLARSIAAMTRSDTINGIPICKEFQMGGGCSRGPAGCRHWHINVDEEKERRRALSIATIRGAGRGGRSADRYGRGASPPGRGSLRRRADPYEYDDYMGGPAKRSAYGMPPVEPAPPSRYVMDLERKNIELMAEVEALRRDLRRERDRYEDLVTIFKETAGSGGATRERSSHHEVVGVPPPVAGLRTMDASWANSAAAMDGKYDWYAQAGRQ